MVITVAFSHVHGVAVNDSGKTYKNKNRTAVPGKLGAAVLFYSENQRDFI